MPSAAVLAAHASNQRKQEEHKKVLESQAEKSQVKVKALFEKSKVYNPLEVERLPKFDKQEIAKGKVLGRGGFGIVNEISAINVSGAKTINSSQQQPADDGYEGLEDKKFIAEHCVRKGGDARYAIKYLSTETKKDPALFRQGVIDMIVETNFLASIEHPNIIKMRAHAAGSLYDSDYFIVLDRLYDTLEQRLVKWGKAQKRNNGFIASKIKDKKGKKKADLFEERLNFAFDLSAAIKYLHGLSIIYRDLKPDNVGFDVRGDIKLFDFGLAKELDDNDKLSDDTWKMSGDTGSLRYMAPEVVKEEPYNYTADVYSLGILIWEMMSLKKPFEGYSQKIHREMVVEKGFRPTCEAGWPKSLTHLIRICWDEDLCKRPSSNDVVDKLKREVAKCRGGDETGLEHFNRRSTFVFRPKKSKSKGKVKR